MGATDYDSSFDRLDDIINEAFGLQPVMTPAEAMTFLERQLFEQRKRARRGLDCIASLPAVEVDEKPQTASDLAALADRYRSVLQDAAEFVRHGTPIHSGSDVAQAILEVLK